MATPNAGYQVLSWGGDCATAGSVVQCTLSNVQAHKSATVSFVAAVVGGAVNAIPTLSEWGLLGLGLLLLALVRREFELRGHSR
jgi:hypothetical protein